MDDNNDPAFRIDLWIQRCSSVFCILAYSALYLTLTCGKRLRRKTYWLQCQLSICVIIRCVCTLIETHYATKIMELVDQEDIFDDDPPSATDRSLSQSEFEHRHLSMVHLQNLIRTRNLFQYVSDFCILSWYTFTLLVSYQFYYDLKRPLTLENFNLKSALYTFGIWLSAFAFCSVFVAVRHYQIPGYRFFSYVEMTAVAVLTLLHAVGMMILIVLLYRLQRRGFIVDLLTMDVPSEQSKIQCIMDGAWCRTRKRHFRMLYICAMFLIISDLWVEAETLCIFVYGFENLLTMPLWVKRVERCTWYLVAAVWPVLWGVCEMGLRKRLVEVIRVIRKKATIKKTVHTGDDETKK